MMKPIIVECRGVAFYAHYVRAVYSTGRRLQVIFWDKEGNVEDRVFEWPWKVMLGSCEGAEEELIY